MTTASSRLMSRAATYLCIVLWLATSIGIARSANAAEQPKITIFAAASLKNALDEASAEFEKSTGTQAIVSYASSSALAKQIEHGAPADVFIGADLDWMNYLAEKGLILGDTRANLLGNRLVLIAPVSSSTALKISPGFALAEALGDGRLAIGDVKAVPAGKYAKAALESLGVWSSVELRLAQAENVRAALALVAQGEVPLGIVYQTDAAAEPKVKVVGDFPESSHPKIVYPIAVTTTSENRESAKALIAFFRSPPSVEIFTKHGFAALK